MPGPQNGRYAAEPITGLTSLKDFELGKKQYNASVQRAVDLGDTVKRIDGSEVPLTTPWLGKAAAPKAGAGAARELPAAAGEALAAGKPAVKVAKPAGVAKAAPGKKTASNDARAPINPATEVRARAAKTAVDAAKPVKAARPSVLKAARGGKADDLKQIWGVGPKLAGAVQPAGLLPLRPDRGLDGGRAGLGRRQSRRVQGPRDPREMGDAGQDPGGGRHCEEAERVARADG